MVSVNALTARRAVAANLRQLGTDLATVQKRMASGLKIAAVRDDVEVWGTAVDMRSANLANSRVATSLAKTRAQAEAAYAGVTTILHAVDAIKLIAADLKGGAATNVDVQKRLDPYQAQLRAVTSAAAVNGGNLLTLEGIGDTTVGTATLTTVVAQNGDSVVTYDFLVRKILGPAGAAGLLNPNNLPYTNLHKATFDASTGQTQVNLFTGAIDTALGTIEAYSGALATFIDGLKSFQALSARSDAIRNSTIGKLVDADIGAETARSKALGARQQLAYQSLAMANRFSRNVLRIFR